MKLFKKLIVALSVLLVVGMLAACSDGNSNSGGGNGGGGKTNTVNNGGNTNNSSTDGYKVVYNGETIYPEEEGDPLMSETAVQNSISMYGLTETTDYSIDQSTKTVILTKSGYDKMKEMEDLLELIMNGSEEDIMNAITMYTIMYHGEEVTEIPEILLPRYKSILEEGEDYTINDSTKTITLTDKGMAKMEQMAGMED